MRREFEITEEEEAILFADPSPEAVSAGWASLGSKYGFRPPVYAEGAWGGGIIMRTERTRRVFTADSTEPDDAPENGDGVWLMPMA